MYRILELNPQLQNFSGDIVPHGSLYANEIDRPALMYVCGAEEKYLRASLNAYRKGKEKGRGGRLIWDLHRNN